MKKETGQLPLGTRIIVTMGVLFLAAIAMFSTIRNVILESKLEEALKMCNNSV